MRNWQVTFHRHGPRRRSGRDAARALPDARSHADARTVEARGRRVLAQGHDLARQQHRLLWPARVRTARSPAYTPPWALWRRQKHLASRPTAPSRGARRCQLPTTRAATFATTRRKTSGNALRSCVLPVTRRPRISKGSAPPATTPTIAWAAATGLRTCCSATAATTPIAITAPSSFSGRASANASVKEGTGPRRTLRLRHLRIPQRTLAGARVRHRRRLGRERCRLHILVWLRLLSRASEHRFWASRSLNFRVNRSRGPRFVGSAPYAASVGGPRGFDGFPTKRPTEARYRRSPIGRPSPTSAPDVRYNRGGRWRRGQWPSRRASRAGRVRTERPVRRGPTSRPRPLESGAPPR